MKNKQIRRIIILIMCLVLVFNLAVSASASSAGGSWSSVSLPADVGVSSVMNGLGVLPGESPDAYNGIVGRCVDYLTEQGRVVGGKIDAWKREQVEGTPWQYGIDVSIIDVIRAWLWNEKIVTENGNGVSTVGSQTIYIRRGYGTWDIWITVNSNVQTYYVTYQQKLNTGVVTQKYEVWLISKTGSFTGTFHDNTVTEWESDTYVFNDESYWYYRTGSTYEAEYTPFASLCATGIPLRTKALTVSAFFSYMFGENSGELTFPDPTVTTDYDVKLGVIPWFGILLPEAYPIWDDNKVLVPPIVGGGSESDDDVIVYPIAPGNTLEDTQDKTQEDVWVGDYSIIDSPAIPDTVTLTDVLSAIISIPQDIVASIIQALSNFFGFSGTADAYAISLTDFFPFCIPFDIYEFLSVLSAAPEAPVFHWEIPVPQLGRTFDIDIDLSPWDPVAAVFRTFELLAFIVGLGMITREKFLRS